MYQNTKGRIFMKKKLTKIIVPVLSVLFVIMFCQVPVRAETQRVLVGKEISLSFKSSSEKDVSWVVKDQNILRLKKTSIASSNLSGSYRYIYGATFEALSVGNTMVSAYDEFGSLIAETEVSVETSKYDFKLDYDCLFLSYGESFKLTPINVPDGSSLVWRTIDPYVSVNQLGVVTQTFPKRVCEVECRTSDGLYSARCTVIGDYPSYYNNVSLMVGQSGKLSFSLDIIDEVPEIKSEYSSTNQSVVTVDNEGVIYAKSPGIANVIAKVGNKELTYTINVSPAPSATPTPTVTPIPTATPTPTDTPSGHSHIYKKVTTKATVSQNGSIVKKCRICGMIASSETIYSPSDISLSETEYVYDGTAKKPSVTVKDSNGNTIASRYYKVSYDTDCKSIGTHNVKITFFINYTGSVTKTFNITKALQEINVSNITIPYVTRTFQANATIRKGDGKLSYKSRNTSIFTVSENGVITPKGVGTAKLTVYASETNTFQKTGKTIYVKVIPNGTGITSLLNDKSRSATIQWKRNKRVNGYQIRYSIYSDFKRSKLITVKKNSITTASIPKLTRGRTYYVQIRTYKTISGKNYYSGLSNVKKVNVTK